MIFMLGFMLDSGDVAEEAQANSAPTCLRVSLILGWEVHLFVTIVLIDDIGVMAEFRRRFSKQLGMNDIEHAWKKQMKDLLDLEHLPAWVDQLKIVERLGKLQDDSTRRSVSFDQMQGFSA